MASTPDIHDLNSTLFVLRYISSSRLKAAIRGHNPRGVVFSPEFRQEILGTKGVQDLCKTVLEYGLPISPQIEALIRETKQLEKTITGVRSWGKRRETPRPERRRVSQSKTKP